MKKYIVVRNPAHSFSMEVCGGFDSLKDAQDFARLCRKSDYTFKYGIYNLGSIVELDESVKDYNGSF